MTDTTASKAPKYFIPFLGPLYAGLAKFAYPIVRITCGALMIPHGWGKLFEGGAKGTSFFMAMSLGGHPKAEAGQFAASWLPWAYYIGLLELVGGILLIVGLLTRVVAAQVVGFMFVSAFIVHWNFGYFWNKAGWEMPLMWMLLALVVLIRGGGEYSIDKAWGREF